MSNKKTIIAGIISLVLFANALFPISVEATNSYTSDSSVRTLEDIKEGHTSISTRGVYLQSGLSRISKAGEGKVTVTGITFAQQEVEEVTVNVELQYLAGGYWTTYKTWTKTAKDDTSVEFVETLDVELGYYYRVKSIHSANSDSSSSFTKGLYIS